MWYHTKLWTRQPCASLARRCLTIWTCPAETSAAATTAAAAERTNEALAKRMIAATDRWFHTIVLGQKLCPFAAPLTRQVGKLRIVASDAQNAAEAIQDIAAEARLLFEMGNSPLPATQPATPTSSSSSSSTTSTSRSDSATHETTLVVLHDEHEFVHNYIDFVRLSWQLQEQVILEQGLEQKLQLVLFHPRAVHQTYNLASSASDYTIRSPYPTVHLLREVDVLAAVQSGYPHLDQLPSRNQARLQAMGVQACARQLAECYQDIDDKNMK